jgi:hypothetical protein
MHFPLTLRDLVQQVIVAARTCLENRYVAVTEGYTDLQTLDITTSTSIICGRNFFREPLPSNSWGDKQTNRLPFDATQEYIKRGLSIIYICCFWYRSANLVPINCTEFQLKTHGLMILGVVVCMTGFGNTFSICQNAEVGFTARHSLSAKRSHDFISCKNHLEIVGLA